MIERRDPINVLVDEMPAAVLSKRVVAHRLLQALWDEGYRLTRRSDYHIDVRFTTPKDAAHADTVR